MLENLSVLFVNKYMIAVLLILIGYIVANFIFKISIKLLTWLELDKLFRKLGLKVSVSNYISHFLEFVSYLVFLIMALDEIGITAWVLNGLGILIILFVLISLLLTIKDLFPNLYASYNLYQNKQLEPGKKIKCNGIEGKVISINSTETIIEGKNGDLIYVPNSYLINNLITVKK